MQDFVKELDTAVYQASFNIEQTDASGGNTVFNLSADNGTRLLITNFIVEMSNLSTPSTVTIFARDSSNQPFSVITSGITLDNNRFTFPHVGTYEANNETSAQNILLVNGSNLHVYVGSLEQNGNYTVRVQGLIRGKLPTTDTSGGSGTPSLTTNIARIV